MKNKYFAIKELNEYSHALKKALQGILDKARTDGTLMVIWNKQDNPVGIKSVDQIIENGIHKMREYPDVAKTFEDCVSECMEHSIIQSITYGFGNFTDADKEPVANTLMTILLSAFSPISPYWFFKSDELQDILISEVGFNGFTLSVFRVAVEKVHRLFHMVTQVEDSHKPYSVQDFTAPREVYRGWAIF